MQYFLYDLRTIKTKKPIMEKTFAEKIMDLFNNEKKVIELTPQELEILFRIAQLSTQIETLTEMENYDKQEAIAKNEKELDEIFQDSGLKEFIRLYLFN